MKTSELIGPALDWAVAKAEGKADDCQVYPSKTVWYRRWTSGFVQYCPSTDWAQGGPIIDQEPIDIFHMEREPPVFEAEIQTGPCKRAKGRGPTHLIAAMRCFVASKLGNEVELPEELRGE